jgi:hypothetical protein
MRVNMCGRVPLCSLAQGPSVSEETRYGGSAWESNQTFNSQLTANDDVAASAKFQLESTGVRTVDLASKLRLLVANEEKSEIRHGAAIT